jgi:D-arabinose 5-phosphate isomerase GutQ
VKNKKPYISNRFEVFKSSLDNSFIQSCKLINQTSGKTIFVGLGKSGHIAEKCAAFVFGFIHKNTIL